MGQWNSAHRWSHTPPPAASDPDLPDFLPPPPSFHDCCHLHPAWLTRSYRQAGDPILPSAPHRTPRSRCREGCGGTCTPWHLGEEPGLAVPWGSLPGGDLSATPGCVPSVCWRVKSPGGHCGLRWQATFTLILSPTIL